MTTDPAATYTPYVAGWVRHNLPVGELDADARAEIEDAIRGCYAAAGREPPANIVWLSSPAAAAKLVPRASVLLLPPTEESGRVRQRIASWSSTVVLAVVLAALAAGVGGFVAYVLSRFFLDDHGWSVFRIAAIIATGVAMIFWFRGDDWDMFHYQAVSRAKDRPWYNAFEVVDRIGRDIYRACVQRAGTTLFTRHDDDWRAQAIGVAAPLERLLSAFDMAHRVDAGEAAAEQCDAALRILIGDVPPDPPDRWRPMPRGLHGDAASAGLAWALRHGSSLELDPADRTALEAWIAAGRVTWWAHPTFAVVAEPPTELHLESLPDGGLRLHRADGPAVAWKDGVALGFWHGVQVPLDLVTHGWPVARIHQEFNSEIQRAAIERMGWLRYLDEAGLELVASCPDPANPPHTLDLYQDTGGRLGDARILVMTNGSPDRSGRERRYAEPVPARLDDPVEAAAWQYGVPVETYRALDRRT